MQPVIPGAQPKSLDRAMLGCVYEFLPVKDGAVFAGTNKLTNELFKANRPALEFQEITSACIASNYLDPSMRVRLDSDMIRGAREIGEFGFNKLLLDLATMVSAHARGAAEEEAEESSKKASQEKEEFRDAFIRDFCAAHNCPKRGDLSEEQDDALDAALEKAEEERFPREKYDPQKIRFESEIAKRVFKLLQARQMPSAEKVAVLVDLAGNTEYFIQRLFEARASAKKEKKQELKSESNDKEKGQAAESEHAYDNSYEAYHGIPDSLIRRGQLELAQFVVEQMPEELPKRFHKHRLFFQIAKGYLTKDQTTAEEASRAVELVNRVQHLCRLKGSNFAVENYEFAEIAVLFAKRGFAQEAVQMLQKLNPSGSGYSSRNYRYEDCVEKCLDNHDYEGALKIVKDYYPQGVEGDPTFGVKNGIFHRKFSERFDEGAAQLLRAGKYQQVLEISRLVFINEKVDEGTKLFSALEQWAETLATGDGKLQEAVNQGAVELLNNIKLDAFRSDFRVAWALEEKLRGLGKRAALLKALDVSETSDVDEETPSQRFSHAASSKKDQKLSFSSGRGGKSIRYLWSTSWIFRILSILTGGLLPLVMFFVEGFSKKPLYRRH